MKLILPMLMCLPIVCAAQNSIKVIIKNETNKAPVAGASLKTKLSPIYDLSDSLGNIHLVNIANGKLDITITCIGYKEVQKTVILPLTNNTVIIGMEPAAQALEEVIVSATRSNRSILNTPTRVEVIAEEEVHEEAIMRPGDIKMLLSESTGIQTQQTSATTGNASIRIQGLDGRYTQILKDGFPIYTGAAGGLGLLQVAPLDLQQVEIIKGASSTLYGGGAIAGLINLVTKVPTEKKELNFHFNATSAGGLDISSFYRRRFKKAGVTLFVSRNSNKAYDPATISFSAIPKFERYTINPKLFLYLSDKATINFSINSTFENRLGGDILFIEGRGDSTHSYFERNKTKRFSSQFTLVHQANNGSNFTIRNSLGYFNRIISSQDYIFNGTQYSSFTEATYLRRLKKSDWVSGINIITDQFRENPEGLTTLRNYKQTTMGAFLQNTFKVAGWLSIETGLRGDYVKDYGFTLLPRVSALIKAGTVLTSRIGGGFGYKPPSIFTEESERKLFRNILPINSAINQLEKSYGLNGDVTYRNSFDEISVTINEFFFYTWLQHPLFLAPTPGGFYQLQNIPGMIVSRGAETNIKLGYDELALYLGYTYTDAKVYNNGTVTQNPLTPKHRFNSALVYEVEGKWKFGAEIYYFSRQELSDGTDGRSYWLTGLVAEKLWKKYSVFINFENFGDTRQTKFGSIFTGTITNPVFKDIYMPLDGFVVNGGIKIRL